MTAVVALAGSLPAPPTSAQTPDSVGVVTTIDGRATVARPALPTPLALKFKDDVYGRDRISTRENSLVRVLLGGKAILTVRELSQVTIHEEPGRAVVTLPDGKVVLAVAKQRMRPGESIEIRTPNVVAAVRGSLISVERNAAEDYTITICGAGNCFVGPDSQNLRQLPPGERARNLEDPAPASSADMSIAFGRGATAFNPPPAGFQTTLITEQTNTAIVVGQFASGQIPLNQQGPLSQATDQALNQTPQTPSSAPVNATTNTEIPAGQTSSPLSASTQGTPGGGNGTPPPTSSGLILNGGFETGSFASWTPAGGGGVVSGLGQVPAPQGGFAALLHTGVGAIGDTVSTLTQSVNVTAGKLYTLLGTVSFYSNEHPFEDPVFNDFWQFGFRQGEMTVQKQENRNDLGVFVFGSTATNTSTAPAGAAGFTTNGPAEYGVTGFRNFSLSFTPTETGVGEVFFRVSDVGDTGVDSAIFFDAVALLEDPPLFFLRPGETLVRTTSEPLLRLTSTPATFDSLLAIAGGGRASLAGPLLRAIDSDLTVPFSLLSVFQGGGLTTSSSEPLVFLSGGTHSFGSVGVPMFDLSGVATAADPETGLPLGTDRPLQHAGALLEASSATVRTHHAVRIDTALLEATAPLLALTNRSALTTAADAVQLSYQAKVTSLGSLVKLDRSSLVVANGAALSLGGGSVLRVTGDLFSLTNGSTLSVLNGPLLSLGGGSILNVNGALVGFGGTGGNLVSVANGLCPCTTIGGLPVSLTGGALASNVSIAGAVKNGNLGSLSLAPNAAVIRVDGAGTKVTIGGL
jgi:hypothetical protein